MYLLRLLANKILHFFKNESYGQRIRKGAVDRPHYGYCVYNAAILAKKLGYKKISVLEFGVAGGDGLINLESHVQSICKELTIDIDIYGFDSLYCLSWNRSLSGLLLY